MGEILTLKTKDQKVEELKERIARNEAKLLFFDATRRLLIDIEIIFAIVVASLIVSMVFITKYARKPSMLWCEIPIAILILILVLYKVIDVKEDKLSIKIHDDFKELFDFFVETNKNILQYDMFLASFNEEIVRDCIQFDYIYIEEGYELVIKIKDMPNEKRIFVGDVDKMAEEVYF